MISDTVKLAVIPCMGWWVSLLFIYVSNAINEYLIRLGTVEFEGPGHSLGVLVIFLVPLGHIILTITESGAAMKGHSQLVLIC